MTKKIKITADMIDWSAYKESIKLQLQNEHLWSLGGSEFSAQNIAELEEEIDFIEEGSYDEVFEKYDENTWRDFLKK